MFFIKRQDTFSFQLKKEKHPCGCRVPRQSKPNVLTFVHLATATFRQFEHSGAKEKVGVFFKGKCFGCAVGLRGIWP